MKTKTPEYLVVTPKNVAEVTNLIKREGGYILIAEPGMMKLFYRPNINGDSLSIDRDKNRNKSRSYLFRKVPKPTGDVAWDTARELFESLRIGPYEFRVGMQCVVGCGVFDKEGVTLYIPENGRYAAALRYAIEQMLVMSGTSLDPKKIPAMVTYATEDLATGRALARNVRAGQEADMMTSLA